MILDRFRLDGRVALVTGGSKGLGKAMAQAFAEAGAEVAIVSRHGEEAEAAAREVANGRRTIGVEADVSQPEPVARMVREVLDRLGRIDILVNNAGINIRHPILEATDDEWQQMVAINLTGPFLCSRAVGPHMIERKSGRVINLSSMLGQVSMPGRTMYATTKGGLIQMTRTLALEWAPYNVTVNALCPGPFMTPLNRSILDNPEAYQFFTSRIPLGRWGDPVELAGAALFLASDAGSFVTGSCLTIDGGWTAQ